MNPEQIPAMMHATPFAPFTIHMTDGQSFYIDHPGFVLFSRERDVLIVSAAGYKTHRLALRNMTRLDSVNPEGESAHR